LLAHCLGKLNRREEAVTALVEFIGQKPESLLLEEAFFQLERLGFFTGIATRGRHLGAIQCHFLSSAGLSLPILRPTGA